MTTPTPTPTLRRAIAHLDARLVPEGPHATDYAYYAAETQRWYVVTSTDLEALGAALDADEPDAYSRWCADAAAEEMPRGWEPDRAACLNCGHMVLAPGVSLAESDDVDTTGQSRARCADTACVC